MEIRKARESDIDPLIELIDKIEKDREKAVKRASRVNSNRRFIFVLEDDSRLIGYAGFSEHDNDKKAKRFVDLSHYANLTWIGVDPDFRKIGYGSKLVLACEEAAIELGKVGVWLDCREKVLPFYCINGYKIRGHYEDIGKPRYVMAKKF